MVKFILSLIKCWVKSKNSGYFSLISFSEYMISSWLRNLSPSSDFSVIGEDNAFTASSNLRNLAILWLQN